MITFACVLRSGGDYSATHVSHLREGVGKHFSGEHQFICLGDGAAATHRLEHNWKGWWSKIELFRPGLLCGQVMYMDLDTIITGSLDWIAEKPIKFAMLENFWAKDRIGSGLMAWNTELIDLSSIYRKFKLSPDRFMREYVTTERWGDQGFIRWNWPEEPARFQRQWPGKVTSYKLGVKKSGLNGASIVCFHGQPRPWQTSMWEKQ